MGAQGDALRAQAAALENTSPASPAYAANMSAAQNLRGAASAADAGVGNSTMVGSDSKGNPIWAPSSFWNNVLFTLPGLNVPITGTQAVGAGAILLAAALIAKSG